MKEWLGVTGQVNKPVREHPKKLILGFDCPRSEVSFPETSPIYNRTPAPLSPPAPPPPPPLYAPQSAALYLVLVVVDFCLSVCFVVWLKNVGNCGKSEGYKVLFLGGFHMGRVVRTTMVINLTADY